MRIANIFRYVLTIGVLMALIFGVINFQAVSDWVRLRNYNPPKRIVQIANETTMNSSTRRVFYVNHPELNDKPSFNGHCRTTEQSIVLGCYIEGKGIYLLDVTDKRLDGVIEVTAAHETLHAEYDRLSNSERKKVDKMTTDFFAGLKNKRIQDTIENYRSQDPSVVPNELHSILGTEVRDLSPELEQYYKKYFNNREKIVEYSENYEQTFVDLRGQIDNYDNQLSSLRQQIDENRGNLESLNSELNSQRNTLDNLLASGEKEEYNQSIPSYNQKVGDYNAMVNETKQLIDKYNLIVDKRNSLATTEQELVKQIDSSQLTEKSR